MTLLLILAVLFMLLWYGAGKADKIIEQEPYEWEWTK